MSAAKPPQSAEAQTQSLPVTKKRLEVLAAVLRGEVFNLPTRVTKTAVKDERDAYRIFFANDEGKVEKVQGIVKTLAAAGWIAAELDDGTSDIGARFKLTEAGVHVTEKEGERHRVDPRHPADQSRPPVSVDEVLSWRDLNRGHNRDALLCLAQVARTDPAELREATAAAALGIVEPAKATPETPVAQTAPESPTETSPQPFNMTGAQPYGFGPVYAHFFDRDGQQVVEHRDGALTAASQHQSASAFRAKHHRVNPEVRKGISEWMSKASILAKQHCFDDETFEDVGLVKAGDWVVTDLSGGNPRVVADEIFTERARLDRSAQLSMDRRANRLARPPIDTIAF